MPSMSYCMFENTASEMSQCVEALDNADSYDDLELSVYEQQGLEDMIKLCQQLLKHCDRLHQVAIEEGYA